MQIISRSGLFKLVSNKNDGWKLESVINFFVFDSLTEMLPFHKIWCTFEKSKLIEKTGES